MQKITIGIQPLAELRAEMLAVARGDRQADPNNPKVRFESLAALAKALQTDVLTVKRVLLPAASSRACWWADAPRPAPSTDDDVLDERQEHTGNGGCDE